MKHQAQCPKCSWTKDYSSESKAKQGLSMHHRRVHSKTIKNTKGKRAAAAKNNSSVNYCPCCGLNLSVLQAAINVANKL